VATVAALYRYPVKSFTPDSRESLTIVNGRDSNSWEGRGLDRVEDLRDQPEEPPVVSYWEARIRRDMPVPNFTELHRTQANIHQDPAQKIRGLSSPECVGVRVRNHLLISGLKVRSLHGSPLPPGE